MSCGDPKCPAHGALLPCGECLRLSGQAFAGNPGLQDIATRLASALYALNGNACYDDATNALEAWRKYEAGVAALPARAPDPRGTASARRWNVEAGQWEFNEPAWGGWCVLRLTPSAESRPMTFAEGLADLFWIAIDPDQFRAILAAVGLDLFAARTHLLRGAEVGAPRLPGPSPEAIEAAAKILYSIGNVRVGLRIWDDVKEHYLREAEAALRAAYAVDGVGA